MGFFPSTALSQMGDALKSAWTIAESSPGSHISTLQIAESAPH